MQSVSESLVPVTVVNMMCQIDRRSGMQGFLWFADKLWAMCFARSYLQRNALVVLFIFAGYDMTLYFKIFCWNAY